MTGRHDELRALWRKPQVDLCASERLAAEADGWSWRLGPPHGRRLWREEPVAHGQRNGYASANGRGAGTVELRIRKLPRGVLPGFWSRGVWRKKASTAVIQEAYIQAFDALGRHRPGKASGDERHIKSQVSRLCEEIDGQGEGLLDRHVTGGRLVVDTHITEVRRAVASVSVARHHRRRRKTARPARGCWAWRSATSEAEPIWTSSSAQADPGGLRGPSRRRLRRARRPQGGRHQGM